jgi:Flp pilus assembly protein TadD
MQLRTALPCLCLYTACGPGEAEILLHEGIVAHQKAEPVIARDRYLRALELDSQLPGVHTNLALLALGEGQLDRAAELLGKELEVEPEGEVGRLNRALLAIRSGSFDRAAQDAEAVWQAAPGSEAVTEPGRRTARLLWAIAARARGEPRAKLAETLRPAADLGAADPVGLAARRLLGVLAYEAGELTTALEHLEAADHPAVRPLRAAICLELGRPREAVELLEGAEGAEAGLLQAHALAATGQPDLARARLEAVFDRSREAPAAVRTAAHRLLARIDGDGGRWSAALSHVDAAALGYETPPVALWVDRALCLAHLGRLDEARVVLGGALREAPEDPRAKALREILR